MNDKPILIADIGGTNARFAIATDESRRFASAQTLEAAEFDNVYDAIDQYLASTNIGPLAAICLAVAGPIREEKVSFPNSHWSIDCKQLRSRYKVEQAKLLNDWEAVAYSLVELGPEDVTPIHSDQLPQLEHDFSLAAIGPGSGLGMAGLLRRENKLIPLVSEGGHVGFSPEDKLQGQVLEYLQNKFNSRISRERLLSGPGLTNLHEALCAIHDVENPGFIAADIAVAAFTSADPLCLETFELFFEILGQVAGDVSLALGAHDGVFIGGGICQRYPQQLLESRFRHGFENKGRYQDLMKMTPSCLITHKNPGLLGASVFASTL